MRASEELDTQVPDKQCGVEFQLFTSLLRFRSGWFANHALRTAAGAISSPRTAGFSNRSVPPSLSSLGGICAHPCFTMLIIIGR
jgi:hypothetical protein